MHWGLRLLENNQIIGEEDFLKDQFFVYSGMYGVPSFCIWWMAPDKTFKIYQGMAFKLFFYRGAYDVYYAEDFMVKSAIYDTSKNLFKIYAVGTSHEDLRTTDFITARVLTNKKDHPISGQKVLKDMFKNAFPYISVWFEEDLVDTVGYFAISFDRDFSCLDLLTKICSENSWEWYLRTDAIFIRKCLQFKDSYITFSEVENETSKSIEFMNYKFIEIEAGTCSPGALYGVDYRVIWVTFDMGGEIGGSMGVMLERNRESMLSEDAYLDTLMNIPEHLVYDRRGNDFRQDPIIVGKIFGKYSNDNRKAYEAPLFSGDVRNFAKWLRKREFKNTYTQDENPLLYNKNVIMSTPFAGDGVGIQYPQVESHRMLIAPAGDREEPVVGNAFYGFNDEVPARESEKDYRLQLPGFCLYVKENGDFSMQLDKDPSEVPEGVDSGEIGMHLIKSGDGSTPEFYLDLGGGDIMIFSQSANGTFQVVSQGTAALQIAKSILIQTTGGDVDIQSILKSISIKGVNVKIIGGDVEINGTKFIAGGVVDATMITTKGGVNPPNVL